MTIRNVVLYITLLLYALLHPLPFCSSLGGSSFSCCYGGQSSAPEHRIGWLGKVVIILCIVASIAI